MRIEKWDVRNENREFGLQKLNVAVERVILTLKLGFRFLTHFRGMMKLLFWIGGLMKRVIAGQIVQKMLE